MITQLKKEEIGHSTTFYNQTVFFLPFSYPASIWQAAVLVVFHWCLVKVAWIDIDPWLSADYGAGPVL